MHTTAVYIMHQKQKRQKYQTLGCYVNANYMLLQIMTTQK